MWIESILASGAISAFVVWLSRDWLSERLKQSIAHEYSQKLEEHKTQLDAKLQDLRHKYELDQLRTSLFFDHQRQAFAEILTEIAALNDSWFDIGYDEDYGLSGPVPNSGYLKLKKLYQTHQLFLDQDCVMAMELLFEAYEASIPFRDYEGDAIEREVRSAYDKVEYIQERIARLFRSKIGVSKDAGAGYELALLGAIWIINTYHFSEIGLPVTGELKIANSVEPGNAVAKGVANIAELLNKLREFNSYLNSKTFSFHQAEAQLRRFIAVLEGAGIRP